MGDTYYLITGPESSGTRLVARTIAHALGLSDFKKWDGHGVVEKDGIVLEHMSIPNGPSTYEHPLDRLTQKEEEGYDVHLVVCIRDYTITTVAKIRDHTVPRGDVPQSIRDMNIARDYIHDLMDSKYVDFIFSYEVLVYLGYRYLQRLYKHFGIVSDFLPEIVDANVKYAKDKHLAKIYGNPNYEHNGYCHKLGDLINGKRL